MIAMPDASTFAVLPWRPGGQGRGAAVLRRRRPPAASPTRATRATCCAARSSGRRRWASTPSTSGPSSSSSTSATPGPSRTASRRSSTRAATSTSPRSTPAPTCAARPCWRSSSSASTWSTPTTRSGPSQHEIDMRYAHALKMADDCMTYRITVKEYAMKYGWHATFMPKPLFGENGSGMHTHQSLFKDGSNAFYDADDQYYLSDVGKAFIAGQLKHAREISLDLRPVGQLLQAAGARLRGARSTAPGRAATARRSCACRSTTPARSRPRGWSCAAPTRPATPT